VLSKKISCIIPMPHVVEIHEVVWDKGVHEFEQGRLRVCVRARACAYVVV
jgi:hypothetical protein